MYQKWSYQRIADDYVSGSDVCYIIDERGLIFPAHLAVKSINGRDPFSEYGHAHSRREDQFLSLFVSLQGLAAEKTLIVPRTYGTGILLDFSVQRRIKALNVLSNRSLFTYHSEAMAPYMLFINSTFQIRVLATRSDGKSSLSEQKTMVLLAVCAGVRKAWTMLPSIVR